MNQTVRHGLPLLAAGQAQKEVTHNEAINAIDLRLQLSVLSRSQTDPPDAPQPGDTYIVPPGATGAWEGAAGKVAVHDGFGWQIYLPATGAVAWVADERGCIVLNDGWSSGWPITSLMIGARSVLAAPPSTLSSPIGGTTVDAEARAAIVALIDALREQGLIS
jgi:hypothetical protein